MKLHRAQRTSVFMGLLLLSLVGCSTVSKPPSAPVDRADRDLEFPDVSPPGEDEGSGMVFDQPSTAEQGQEDMPLGIEDNLVEKDAAKPAEPAPRRPAARATVALLDAAARFERQGNLERAAAMIERALRIDPRNAQLWHRLAAVRFSQGQYGQAASLAAKSNSLSGQDTDLVEENDRIIREARLR